MTYILQMHEDIQPHQYYTNTTEHLQFFQKIPCYCSQLNIYIYTYTQKSSTTLAQIPGATR
jgi:hypothetical protein